MSTSPAALDHGTSTYDAERADRSALIALGLAWPLLLVAALVLPAGSTVDVATIAVGLVGGAVWVARINEMPGGQVAVKHPSSGLGDREATSTTHT